jgi:lambda family phage portal protein
VGDGPAGARGAADPRIPRRLSDEQFAERARAIEDQWADNVVGDGPSARSAHPNPAMRRAQEAAWVRFFGVADIERGDLTEHLKRVVRSVVKSGEAFVRFLTTERGELRLQLLASEQIDASINRELDDGGRIIAGIEIGPNGERRAYWILPQAPDLWITMLGPAVRVDAADICHVFEPRDPGQVRGISWLTAVATRLLDLDGLEDALLMRMRVAALFAAFITDPEGTSDFTEGATTDPAQRGMEPGVMQILRGGQSVTFPQVPGIEGAPEILKHMLRSIAAGSGVPYELLASDLSSTNYSSAKMGLEAFRRRVRSIQASMLGARLLTPIWRRLQSLEILSGRLQAPGFVRDPESFFAVSFLWPAWASLDPLKESEADQVDLAIGVKSRAQIIAERGRDIADVDAEIDADPRPLPAPRPIEPRQPGRIANA